MMLYTAAINGVFASSDRRRSAADAKGVSRRNSCSI